MTQQLDPKQVNGLSASMAKTAGLANIKTIGANLDLTDDGTLNATGGGGGGGGTLYPSYGQNIDGAMTQKASTNLFVHTAPDGTNNLIDTNNKITEGYLPDYILGQVVYGGNFDPTTAVATLSDNAKAKLGTESDTIVLTNDTTEITGYVANSGIYYICTAGGSFAGLSFLTGDWLISNGSSWQKIDNTDAVTGVKGNAEASYRIGNVNITAANVGAAATSSAAGDADKLIKADGSYSVANTANIADNAITTAKINDRAVTSVKMPSNTLYWSTQGTPETPSPWIEATDIIWSTMINKIYPIGSIFMSATLSTASAVGNALGGTWEAWGAGRVPVGVDTTQTEFDTAEETGGNKIHTHEYGMTYAGWYRHTILEDTSSSYGGLHNYAQDGTYTYTGGGPNIGSGGSIEVCGNIDIATATPGRFRMTANAKYNSTLQPYITCYMYKRIA